MDSILKEQEKELIKNEHNRILFERDRTPLGLNEIALGLRIINSTDTTKRKEEMRKEIHFIWKK
jgi:hypothetical protein